MRVDPENTRIASRPPAGTCSLSRSDRTVSVPSDDRWTETRYARSPSARPAAALLVPTWPDGKNEGGLEEPSGDGGSSGEAAGVSATGGTLGGVTGDEALTVGGTGGAGLTPVGDGGAIAGPP